MSRESVLLAALTTEPTSTSELYTRIGYMQLTQLGLIPYVAFKAELAKLEAAGLAQSQATDDESATLWWLTQAAGV